MIPFIKVLLCKLTALQCWIVCQVTGYHRPSATHIFRHAPEHRATCSYAFKSSLIPSLLSTSQNDLAYPVLPQTESTRASLVPPKLVLIQSRLCNVFWYLSIIFKTPNTEHFQPFKNYPESQFSIKINLELFTQIHLLFMEPFSRKAAPFFQALPLHWPKGYQSSNFALPLIAGSSIPPSTPLLLTRKIRMYVCAYILALLLTLSKSH